MPASIWYFIHALKHLLLNVTDLTFGKRDANIDADDVPACVMIFAQSVDGLVFEIVDFISDSAALLPAWEMFGEQRLKVSAKFDNSSIRPYFLFSTRHPAGVIGGVNRVPSLPQEFKCGVGIRDAAFSESCSGF